MRPADQTIGYVTHTHNPIRARLLSDGTVGTACVKHSAGCANCYAETLNHRFWTRLPFTEQSLEQVEFFLDEDKLTELLRARPGKRIFVGDMLDLWLPQIGDDLRDPLFTAFAARLDLTFLVLSKRAPLQAAYLMGGTVKYLRQVREDLTLTTSDRWPLPNVWVGVTAENQEMVEARLPWLLAAPAAVRWVSIEPMLGPVDLTPYLSSTPRLDWVVVGGETGRHARPMNPAWVRALRDQCVQAGVAFWFKSWGHRAIDEAGQVVAVGKDAAHHVLDGEDWRQLPGER